MQKIINYAQVQLEYHPRLFISETLEPKPGSGIAGKEIFRRYRVGIEI
jgi:hypothetical protein